MSLAGGKDVGGGGWGSAGDVGFIGECQKNRQDHIVLSYVHTRHATVHPRSAENVPNVLEKYCCH